MTNKLGGRRCEICGKPLGVTWHRMIENGKTRSVMAHLQCFIKYRKEASSFCRRCEAGLTTTDFQARRCTQCGEKISVN